MLATALSSLPCGAVILGIGGRPEEFMDDKCFDRLKVRVLVADGLWQFQPCHTEMDVRMPLAVGKRYGSPMHEPIL
jgi:hypothetical protein